MAGRTFLASWQLSAPAARPPPCSIGYPARRGLQTYAPSLSTVVRDADTLLPCSGFPSINQILISSRRAALAAPLSYYGPEYGQPGTDFKNDSDFKGYR